METGTLLGRYGQRHGGDKNQIRTKGHRPPASKRAEPRGTTSEGSIGQRIFHTGKRKRIAEADGCGIVFEGGGGGIEKIFVAILGFWLGN